MLQQRPNTFAQTNLSPSFFACDKAADHTFRVATRTLALSLECMLGCAQKVLDTADIVRDGDLSTVTLPTARSAPGSRDRET